MTAKRFICLAGWVYSVNDHQRHRIPASRLPGLYHVPSAECYFCMDEDQAQRFLEREPELAILRPKADGNYQLP